jgi:opacity protein-like surface antigen
MNFFSKTLAVAALSIAAIASPASAEEAGLYVTAGVGTGFNTEVSGEVSGFDVEYDARTTVEGGIGLGYDTGENIRVELGVARSSADVDSVKISGVKYDVDESGEAWSVGTRFFYDFANDSDFTPFVGTGVSLSWGDDTDDTAYSIPVIAGVSYEATEDVDIYGQLTYAMTPAQDIGAADVDFVGEFGVSMGIRFAL